MPTIIDTIALELQLDSKQFEEGLKSVVEKVRVTRDDYERHAKGFEAVATSLFRAINPLIGALLSIGAAIAAIDWTKHAAAATTQFGNLAEVIGMTIPRLSAWQQAAKAAGGSSEELTQSMARTQKLLQQAGPGGAGLTDPALGMLFHHYGLNSSNYYNTKTRLYDIDRLYQDIAKASQRMNENAGMRASWLEKLGITDVGLVKLLSNFNQLDEALKKQIEDVGVLSKDNVDAMKLLNTDFVNLATAAKNLGIEVVTNLAKPLHEALEGLQKILSWLKDWSPPNWLSYLSPLLLSLKGYQSSNEGFWEYWFMPHRPPTAEGARPSASAPGSPSTAAPTTAPPSANSVIRTPPATTQPMTDPLSGLPLSAPSSQAPSSPPTFGTPPPSVNIGTGGAAAVGARTGVRGTGQAPSQYAPSPSPTPTTAPAGPPSEVAPGVPGTRLPEINVTAPPGPQGALQLPQFAMNTGRQSMAAASTPSNISNSNINIGDLNFHDLTNDSALDVAPAGFSRGMAVAAYAVHSDQSLE